MSCNCNSNTVSACGDVNIPVVSAGVKISQLPQTTSAAPNDLFVIVDYSAQKTKNISFYNLIQAVNSGTNIVDVSGVGTYLRETGGWVYFDPNSKFDTSAINQYTTTADFESHTSNTSIHYVMSAIDHTVIQNIGTHTHDDIDLHIEDLSIHFPMSAIDGLIPVGGTSGQVLIKNTSADYDYSWGEVTSGEFVKITELGNTGYVIGSVDRASKLPIGDLAIDLGTNIFGGSQGNYSFSTGLSTSAIGQASTAQGSSSLAFGPSSHAEGYQSQGIGDSSHAEGYNSSAIGSYSHAEGMWTISEGIASHTEGEGTRTIGHAAHAEGQNTIARAISHAEGKNTESIGTASHAEGQNTKSYGDSSHAEGIFTSAIGPASHSEGYYTISEGAYTHSEGDGTVSKVHASHAEGYLTSAMTHASHAEGQNTLASGNISHAEGSFTRATGDMSHAEGQTTSATGFASHTEGDSTIAIGMRSHAEGLRSIASGDDSHAEGNTTIASGVVSHAAGYQTSATEFGSHSEGEKTQSLGKQSHVEGFGSIISTVVNNIDADTNREYNASHAEGYRTYIEGIACHTEGLQTSAYSQGSHAEGYKTISYGTYTHTEGEQTIAQVHASHAEGYLTSATAHASHAEGSQTIASGDASHAEGNLTIASGPYTHAEGNSSHAEGSYTHAEGDGTLSQVHASHAEGYLTSATANASHAEGFQTLASGDSSHAEGNTTIASGFASHAEGQNNTVTGSMSHVEGSDNFVSGDQAHAGGNSNSVTGNYSVSYGNNNVTVGANSLTVGSDNTVNGNANIIGGVANNISDTQSRSSLISGENNIIGVSVFSSIVGNGNEIPVGVSSFIGGFENKLLDATKSINSTVVVGRSNSFWGDTTDSIIAMNGLVLSGSIYPQISTSIIGGRGHNINLADAMLIGGLDNTIDGVQGFVTGEYNNYYGSFNSLMGSHSTIFPNITRACSLGQFSGIGADTSVTVGKFTVAGINGGTGAYGDMFTCDFTFNTPANTIDIVASSSQPGFTFEGYFTTGQLYYSIASQFGHTDTSITVTDVDYYEVDNKVTLTYSGTNINTIASNLNGYIINFRPNLKTVESSMFVGGIGSTGHGDASFTFGNQLINTGTHAVAFGNFNNSLGYASFTHGNFNTAKGVMSYVYGNHSTGIGDLSFTTGTHNLTYGSMSTTFGTQNENYTDLSFISGDYNTVGVYISQSDFSVNDTNTNGVWKLTGDKTNLFVTGDCSFVYDGPSTYKDAKVNITSVSYSVGTNDTTINYSLIGYGVQYVPRTTISRIKPNNSTSGKNSTVFGSNNVTITDYSFVAGVYNEHKAGNIFEVGVGLTSATRKNAFEITSAGVLSAPQQNGKIVNDDHLVTKLYVTSAIASIPSSVSLYGVTSARPITPPIGTPYLDTTLGYPIWYLSPNWINATGATV